MKSICSFFLFALLLATCSRTPSSENGNASDASSQLSSRPLVSVTFTPQWVHQAQFAGFYVAQKKGYYRQNGLDVTIKPGSSVVGSAELLKQGETDFTTLFLLTAMKEYDSGNKLVNIAQLSQASNLMLTGKRNNGISSIESLKGKRLGLWGSDFYHLSKILLKTKGINADIIPIENSINPFLTGAIDAMNVMHYNEFHQIIQAGIDEQDLWVYRFADHEYDIPEDGIYTSLEFYEANPNVCKDFADASIQGWLYAINNPNEAVSMVMEVMREYHVPSNVPHQQWMLNSVRSSILAKPGNIGILRESDFEKAHNLLMDNGLIKSNIDFGSFYRYDNK